MATPSRSVILPPVRRSPRLLHRQLAGSKRHSSDTDHLVDYQAPPKAPRVPLGLDYLLNSVSSDVVIASQIQLTRCTDDSGCKQLLVVSSKRLHRHEPAGFVSRLRMIVSEDQTYQLQVLLKTIEEGTLHTVPDFHVLCQRILSPINKFCLGLSEEEYKGFRKDIRYDPSNVHITTESFKRIESTRCKRWFTIARNAPLEEKSAEVVKCTGCKKLIHDLERSQKRASTTSPRRKQKRLLPSSHFPKKYLSPSSQQRRTSIDKCERRKDKRLLRKYAPNEIMLDDQQHDELLKLVTEIDTTGSDNLHSVYSEAEQHGARSVFESSWNLDLQRNKKLFEKDQLRNAPSSKGGHSNRWSAITIRIALAIYARSPAAYRALQSFGVLNLPSKATLQAHTGAFLYGAGPCEENLRKQVGLYKAFVETKKAENKHVPLAVGVLIFDEVKVISRLMWNSRSQQMIGLAMQPEDMASLLDIYSTYSESGSDAKTDQTSYIMQFLWRDLTSSYDIVGPYYTSSSSFKSKSIIPCVMQTIKLFFLYGFKVIALVCDGASANLTTLKASTGVSGAYSSSNSTDKYPVQPWFPNPFEPTKKIYWIICPTHQLKNMINALFSSRSGGTKRFVYNRTNFGWKAIEDMYVRDCGRAERGVARMVPKLREVHIIRDSWTKLNVTPAKIMQQKDVLTEIHTFVTTIPRPVGASEAEYTLKFLEACNLMFEKGFLSHDKVSLSNKEVVANIKEGYNFFCKWLDAIYKQDPKFSSTKSTQKSFLSWQTWDLLRIDTFGFTALCDDFTHQFPNYFISSLRISGSAVESLFSQFKYSAGGKLDAANYQTAQASFLVKQAVQDHHSGVGYRDGSLQVHTEAPKRKQYQRKNS